MAAPHGLGMRPLVLPLEHRDDLQGLRAIAVLLVALSHAGVSFLKGGYVGVDVFFVLSGFLITGLLLGGAAKHGRISLVEFYRRRARRILPAAVLTLVVTDLVAWQLLNFVRAKQTVLDSIWASVFAANIHFGRENADYFARLKPPSPIQQFWTLSVEEQFYLGWPLLLSLVLFGVLVWQRKSGVLSHTTVTRALWFIALAGFASFAWSVHSTQTNPEAAYFSTFGRLWELALGAALAIAAPRLAGLPGLARIVFGWAGVACIVLAGVLYSSSTRFPGYAALLPTIGSALVIVAAVARKPERLSAGRVLSVLPFRYIGDRSYALYLWHWPVLVIAAEYAGHELSTGVNLALLVGAFVLSIVSYASFENPIRHMKSRSPLQLILWPASVAAVLVVALPLLSSLGSTAARFEDASAQVNPHQLVDPSLKSLSAQPKPLPAVVAAVKAAQAGKPIPWPLTPAVSKVERDRYAFPSKKCRPDLNETSSDICHLGDKRAAKTIVMFGDSHAVSWLPAVVKMAKHDGWLVIPLIKPSCVPGKWVKHGFATCNTWYKWAMQQAQTIKPSVAIVAAKWSNTQPAVALSGVSAAVADFKRVASSVMVVGDPPEEKQTPVDCLLARHATMKTCSPPARALDLVTDDAIAATAKKHHAGFIYTRGWFCAKGTGLLKKKTLCPIVINRTITRSDKDHVSKTYALELERSFRAAFRQALFT